jgi:hypothetical protein
MMAWTAYIRDANEDQSEAFFGVRWQSERDTALDRLEFRLQAGSSLIDQGRLKAELRTKAPSRRRHS